MVTDSFLALMLLLLFLIFLLLQFLPVKFSVPFSPSPSALIVTVSCFLTSFSFSKPVHFFFPSSFNPTDPSRKSWEMELSHVLAPVILCVLEDQGWIKHKELEQSMFYAFLCKPALTYSAHGKFSQLPFVVMFCRMS